MRTIKQPETTHTSLHHCLEAHFGTRRNSSEMTPRKYREPEQGFHTVLFQSHCPLQLDYMRRRKSDSFIRTAFGFITLKRNPVK